MIVNQPPLPKTLSGLPEQVPSQGAGSLVSILVVTYEPDPELLRECLSSLVASTYRPLEVVVVDNGSRRRDTQALVVEQFDDYLGDSLHVRYAGQATNLGYAAATNIGIESCRGDLVLLLNPDASVEASTITLMVEAASRHPEAAGLAPKILLANPGVVIDSVGMSLHSGGEGSQRGLGQADIGQYDREEMVAGLCFAAALIRRDRFNPDQIGLLDERFFLFYEDVDWSLRTQILGDSFWTVPTARVTHFHSASTRHLGASFKNRLVQRNLIWAAIKNLESQSAVRALLRRSLRDLERFVALRQAASARAVVEAWTGLPGMLRSRRRLQRRRRRPDAAFISHSIEPTFFDLQAYRPEVSVNALIFILSRLYALAPEAKLERTLSRVRAARETGSSRDRASVAAIVRDGGLSLGPGLEWLLHELESQPA